MILDNFLNLSKKIEIKEEKPKKKKEINIIKIFKKFIDSGFNRHFFTQNLYQYICCHCNFIAHYNIHGFYTQFFTNVNDVIKFVESFERFVPKNDNNEKILNMMKDYLQMN